MGGGGRGAPSPSAASRCRVMLPRSASSQGWGWFVKKQGPTSQVDLFFKNHYYLKKGQKSVFCRKVGILAELSSFFSDRARSVGRFLREKRENAAFLFQVPSGCKHCSAASPGSLGSGQSRGPSFSSCSLHWCRRLHGSQSSSGTLPPNRRGTGAVGRSIEASITCWDMQRGGLTFNKAANCSC